MNLNLLSTILLSILLSLILTLCFFDYYKKRKLTNKPFLSFLIPCYNCEKTIEQTIVSIYNSYEKSNFEIIIINDCSDDNSLKIIKKLRNKYNFKIINNKNNIGKSKSLNQGVLFAKSDILFFIDSDSILNKKAINDILARLSNKDVSAVSSPYKPKNSGFLASMQELEYNMLSFVQGAQNHFSAIGLWGGCFAVKRKAFEEVNGFSEGAITEDLDLCLKLKRKKLKVEQSFCRIETNVPITMKAWYRQKLRWSSGSAQNFIKHIEVILTSPLQVLFLLFFSILSFIFIISIMNQVLFINHAYDNYTLLRETNNITSSIKSVGYTDGKLFFKNVLLSIFFAIFSLPYVIPSILKFKDLYKILFLIPYSLIYMPIFSIVSSIGFFVAVFRYNSLKHGKRAW